MANIELRPYQKEARDKLVSMIKKGGEFNIPSPVGTGRTIVAMFAAAELGRVAYITSHPGIYRQTESLIEQLGAENVDLFKLNDMPRNLDKYDVIFTVVHELMRSRIKHRCKVDMA